MNTKRQIEYWINTAQDDLETAELLINSNKILHGLFFCHLSVEKAIKAHIVRCTANVPPKIHNLAFLLEKTDLKFNEHQLLLCDKLMFYQLEGRYPEFYPKVPSKQESEQLLQQSKELLLCLKRKL